jgi:L-ribulose-5-phosphate 4-epimerase
MAFITITINPGAKPLPEYITKKHWERKHGKQAYYGQN